MGFEIKDGTGSNRRAQVDIYNRLQVDSVTVSEREAVAEEGNAYLIGSGFVTLTSANSSAVLWFKNDNDFDLVITRYLVGVRASTGGTENHVRGIIYRNPTAISGGSGSPLLAPNINFGSSNTLTLSSEIGAEAATLTGGTPLASVVAPVEQLTAEAAATIMPKGSSIGVLIIPPTSNTSLQVSVGLNAHKRLETI
jgi:hypothetical protein